MSTNANGVVTTFGYDVQGRLISKTAAGRTTSYEYDGAGNLIAAYLPGGKDLFYSYTNADLLEKIEDNAGDYIQYFYDTEGNRIREEIHDHSGLLRREADFEFDYFNRLVKTIYPGGHFEERDYDDNGSLTRIIDPNGHATQYDYDPLNRLVTVTQPGDVVTGYDYDRHDNLVSVTDAKENTTTYIPDDFGSVISTTSPDTNTSLYASDPAGNLVSKTDANGNTVTYTYDALNRLTAIQYPDPTQNIIYSYDEETNGTGRLTGMTDASGGHSYVYDELGRLMQEIQVVDGQEFTIEYAYDENGEMVSVTYPGGRTVTSSPRPRSRSRRVGSGALRT